MVKDKGVLAKMGLIQSVQSVSDASRLLIDSEFYNKISDWEAMYQGEPSWQNDRWQDIAGNPRNRKVKSLQMPKILAKKMAGLVFNQKATITISDKVKPGEAKTDDDDTTNPANQFIQDVLNDNYFYHNCERYLEYMFATGGMVMRWYVFNGHIKIRFASADSFFPISQDENGVTECVIASKFVDSGNNYTLLEYHLQDDTNYIIKNELYKSNSSTGDELGIRVPLSTLYGNSLKDETHYPRSVYSRPTFVYLKPNLANNFDLDSPLGISIFGNATDTLHELDQAFDMLGQEMKMGKRRIVAPDYMLQTVKDAGSGQRRYYIDTDNPAFMKFHAQDSANANIQGPKDITLGLRNDTFINTINSLLDIVAAQTGFSAGTFSYNNSQGLETATGVISRNSDTYQSKNSHETIIEDGIRNMCISILELGKAAGLYSGETDEDVTVDFDDSIAQDRNENADYYLKMNGNKPLMSQREAIKKANNLTDKGADEMLNAIHEENSQGDINDILGNEGNSSEDNQNNSKDGDK